MDRNRLDRKLPRTPSGAAVRSDGVTDALHRALFLEWAERGFSAVSLERVAARANAGKAAIYRRFSSRHEFAAAAVSAHGLKLAVIEDRGSLEADILAFLFRLRTVLRHPIIRRILPDLHAEAARSSEMRLITKEVAEARRTQGVLILDRAVERGELAATLDRELALDLIPAPLYWRMVVIGVTPTKKQLFRESAAIAAALRSVSSQLPRSFGNDL